jgi:hypothetical protein
MKNDQIIEKYQFTEETKQGVFMWARSIQSNVYPVFRNDKPVLLIPLPDDISNPAELHIGDWIYKVSENQVAKLN